MTIHSHITENEQDQLAQGRVIKLTRQWLEKAVIGLNLCPFAKAVYIKNQIRYAVSDATTAEELCRDLVDELSLLARTPADQIDTTILIHPWVLTDFLDYNDFLDIADAALEQLDLEGVIQIASFHPDYQFGDAAPDDISNFTNRAPYPILHLLREASIDRAVEAFPDAEDIFNRNIDTMRQLGHDGWQALGLTTRPSDTSKKG